MPMADATDGPRGTVDTMRTSASTTVPLTTEARKPVTGTRAEAYASGAQPWNGNTAALRKNPLAIRITAVAA